MHRMRNSYGAPPYTKNMDTASPKAIPVHLEVIIALMPAVVAAVCMFGFEAALLTGVCVAASVFFEWGFGKLLKKENTTKDLSAVITGLLLALNLPVTIPLWQAVFGCFAAIILVKQIFGGLGKNFANPAATARVMILVAFPAAVSPAWAALDAVTGATPLVDLLSGEINIPQGILYLFLGVHGSHLGDTSWLALLAGGIYLLIRRVITWQAPAAFIGTVCALAAVLGDDPLYQVFSGGLFLGAFFMAADYVTTPLTKPGRFIFGIGAGLFTIVIRLYGTYPDGVPFAILLMNMLVPYINKLTITKPRGGTKP